MNARDSAVTATPLHAIAPPPFLSPQAANKINPVLLWNQPHVIWLADAQRRAVNASSGGAAALATATRLAPLVFATADFLADRPFFNESAGGFELAPPLLGAEEMGDFMRIARPTYETVYTALALDLANEWRVLLGLPEDAHWANVSGGLGNLPLDPAESPPAYSFNAAAACCYVPAAQCPPGRFGGRDQCSPQEGHPSPSAVLGMIDGRYHGDKYGVNAATANATVKAITERWAWSAGGSWGWDNVRGQHSECVMMGRAGASVRSAPMRAGRHFS